MCRPEEGFISALGGGGAVQLAPERRSAIIGLPLLCCERLRVRFEMNAVEGDLPRDKGSAGDGENGGQEGWMELRE